MKVQYKPKSSRLQQEDVDVIVSFIQTHKAISPKDLVDFARPAKSPIHRLFEWDDKKAAEAFRIEQAREILQQIVVEIEEHQGPAFVSVKLEKDKADRRYIPTELARTVPNLWDQVLDKALQDLESWKARYRTLQELTPLIDTINKTQRRLGYGKEKGR